MIVSDAGNTYSLTSRIFRLSSSDRMLLERFLDTLEARSGATAKEASIDRLRRRIESVRSQKT